MKVIALRTLRVRCGRQQFGAVLFADGELVLSRRKEVFARLALRRETCTGQARPAFTSPEEAAVLSPAAQDALRDVLQKDFATNGPPLFWAELVILNTGEIIWCPPEARGVPLPDDANEDAGPVWSMVGGEERLSYQTAQGEPRSISLAARGATLAALEEHPRLFVEREPHHPRWEVVERYNS